MRRFEAMGHIMEAVTEELLICNIGHPAQELFSFADRPENFYMLGSMGLASSIGLGLAMSQEKTVVVIDGDGAVAMNLGTLATIGKVRPANYVLIIIDNEAYGSTGFQWSFTAGNLRLDAVAQACGIESVTLIEREADIKPSLERLFGAADGPNVLVIKTDPGMPEGIEIIPIEGVAIRDRFMAAVKA